MVTNTKRFLGFRTLNENEIDLKGPCNFVVRVSVTLHSYAYGTGKIYQIEFVNKYLDL